MRKAGIPGRGGAGGGLRELSATDLRLAAEIRAYAAAGLGIDDIVVKMGQAGWHLARADVKRIVLENAR